MPTGNERFFVAMQFHKWYSSPTIPYESHIIFYNDRNLAESSRKDLLDDFSSPIGA